MTAPPGTQNRTIVIIAEGDTERAARDRLKEFLDEHAGNAGKVRLKVVNLDGGLSECRVHDVAERELADSATLGVVALTDVFPNYRDANHAREVVASWMPEDPRCHVHVAKHDFEAWLLADWNAVLKKAGVANKNPWGANPEEINNQQPPAHRIRKLFAHEGNTRRYKKTVEGKILFANLDLDRAAKKCPELKAFLNCLLSLAGYGLLE